MIVGGAGSQSFQTVGHLPPSIGQLMYLHATPVKQITDSMTASIPPDFRNKAAHLNEYLDIQNLRIFRIFRITIRHLQLIINTGYTHSYIHLASIAPVFKTVIFQKIQSLIIKACWRYLFRPVKSSGNDNINTVRKLQANKKGITGGSQCI